MDEIWNRFRVPKVFIGMESSLPNSSSVFVDGVALGVSAARAFLLRGHRRFGYLCNSESNRQGFLTALQDAGIPQENIHLKQCRNFWEEGLNATRHLLSEHPEITALFADSDLLGAAALKIASEIGRRIPNDLAVIGVDDSPICRMITPELSSLHQPRSEQGTAAAQMLLDMCNGNEVKNKVFFGDLVIRRSLEEKA